MLISIADLVVSKGFMPWYRPRPRFKRMKLILATARALFFSLALSTKPTLPPKWQFLVQHRFWSRTSSCADLRLTTTNGDLGISKGCKPAVSPPVQMNPINLNHCARFVFLSRDIMSLIGVFHL